MPELLKAQCARFVINHLRSIPKTPKSLHQLRTHILAANFEVNQDNSTIQHTEL